MSLCGGILIIIFLLQELLFLLMLVRFILILLFLDFILVLAFLGVGGGGELCSVSFFIKNI